MDIHEAKVELFIVLHLDEVRLLWSYTYTSTLLHFYTSTVTSTFIHCFLSFSFRFFSSFLFFSFRFFSFGLVWCVYSVLI